MKYLIHFILFLIVCITTTSCYIQHPRFSSLEEVNQLTTGISLDSVNSILGCEPYDFISLDTSGTRKVLYKYRVNEIRRIPVIMKKTKGMEVTGGWKDLIVTISPQGEVISYNTSKEEIKSKTIEKKADPDKVLQALTTIITVTLPAVLVYFSIN